VVLVWVINISKNILIGQLSFKLSSKIKWHVLMFVNAQWSKYLDLHITFSEKFNVKLIHISTCRQQNVNPEHSYKLRYSNHHKPRDDKIAYILTVKKEAKLSAKVNWLIVMNIKVMKIYHVKFYWQFARRNTRT